MYGNEQNADFRGKKIRASMDGAGRGRSIAPMLFGIR
jgi:hypothetical protein